MRLRPYHNPENVDESKVPDGWRFRYADEMAFIADGQCRAWAFWGLQNKEFDPENTYFGTVATFTYIVPVA